MPETTVPETTVPETTTPETTPAETKSNSSGGSSGGGSVKPVTIKEAEVSASMKLVSGDGTPGTYMTYEIEVTNSGTATALGIRIRDYMPEYSHFEAFTGSGSYGVIDGYEHVTWFIERLAPGQSKSVRVTILVDTCKLGEIENTATFEVTGSTTKPYTNKVTDPSETVELS